MREVNRDEKFPEEYGNESSDAGSEHLEPVLDNTEPTTQELITISLLMRNYDLLLALLNHFDKELADEVWEAHSKGGHMNPAMFLPDLSGEHSEDPEDAQ